jgi:very-short-patch-repair endonuclease
VSYAALTPNPSPRGEGSRPPFSLWEKGLGDEGSLRYTLLMPIAKIYAHPQMRDRARELRHPQTPMETKLWAQLRNRQLGNHKFRRQHPIDRFILDFYCVELKLAIEIDGAHHEVEDQAIYDALRTEALGAHGITVVRFTNPQVFHEFEVVLQIIWRMCEQAKATQGDLVNH